MQVLQTLKCLKLRMSEHFSMTDLQWWVRMGLGEMHFLQMLDTCSRTVSVGGRPGDVVRAIRKWNTTFARSQ